MLAFALLSACGQELAQTADPIPPPPMTDCTSAIAPILARATAVGPAGAASSILVGHGYGAENGPGLFVNARDAFRVFLNADLAAESSSPRSTQFVPLSLLPGDNVLAVVVAAGPGDAPAVVLELDELDRDFMSDTTWRVSTAPSPGFERVGFDDSAWSPARDLGTLGTLGNCDAGTSFPSDSTAHWIGPGSGDAAMAVFRKVISIVPEGFGAGTTGGSGASPTIVDRWDQLQAAAADSSGPSVILLADGDHDFRDVPRLQSTCPTTCTSDATKALYTVITSTTNCAQAPVDRPRDDRTLMLGSNKTLVGLGRGASIRGVTLEAGSSHNIIVRNVALYDVNPELVGAGDAFSLTTPSQVWIDHCTTKWISDGLTDIRANAENVTLSWMHYDGATPYACDLHHSRASDASSASVTYHHCFFDHVETHTPRVDGAPARVHLYDNLISDNPGYAVGSYCGAQVLMEANTFRNVMTFTERAPCPDQTMPGLIQAPPSSNDYSGVGSHGGGDGTEPHDATFAPSYVYHADVAAAAAPVVQQRAGAGGRWASTLTLN